MKKELYQYLATHPHLIEYQVRLEQAMDKVCEEDRLKVLAVFLQYNLADLKFELERLRSVLC